MPSFRYQVTLNAPTAMIKHADEIPITYLNKGQAYSISIVDSFGVIPSPSPIKYRTVVRISFEDEQQRQRPAACWQLWKEGRGLAEAHQRGGKLQAVEYVDPNQGGGVEPKRSRVELETASFDCFSVTWTPTAGGSSADCSVAVRFNFLSTDFSHSKGVKGIPVRLCAKTEILSSGTPDSPPGPVSEVCFCKVKLFRDHGAERKLSNDVTHIKKTIDKFKQQIAQAESGMKEFGKRKRSGSLARASSNRPGKVQKHKRTWSVSSQGSSGRIAPEEDLHFKLAAMQDMFTSTRPLSLLYLKGYEEDDPDLYPVALLGPQHDHVKAEIVGKKTPLTQKASEATSPSNSAASPSTSSPSMLGQTQSANCTGYQHLTPEHQLQEDWDAFASFTNPNFHATHSQNAQSLPGPSVKVQRSQSDTETTKWIESFGVDPTYQAPAERVIKPVACFYIMVRVPDDVPDGDCYRAVYLMERTVKDLINNIAMKCDIEPSRIVRTLRINSKGFKIIVDNEVVREMQEGQDMIAEYSEARSETAVKQEGASPSNAKLELRLYF